jgi:hypothetical protein
MTKSAKVADQCRKILWQAFSELFHLSDILGGVSTWNAQLQARFGFIELTARPLEGRYLEARSWLMGKARRTNWGEAVAWAVMHFLDQQRSVAIAGTSCFSWSASIPPTQRLTSPYSLNPSGKRPNSTLILSN